MNENNIKEKFKNLVSSKLTEFEICMNTSREKDSMMNETYE